MYIYIYMFTYWGLYLYTHIYIDIGFNRGKTYARSGEQRVCPGIQEPANLPREFQTFGSENHFRAGGFSVLG